MGVASAWQGVNYHFGYPDISSVHLEITEDGRCRISTSVADMGQGIPETLAKIVSSELGNFPLESIDFVDPDTRITPDGGATGASRLTAMAGNATGQASQQLAFLMKVVAAEMLDIAPDRVILTEGEFQGTAENTVKFSEVINECRQMGINLETRATYTGPPTEDLDEMGQGYGVNDFSYATYTVEVEVDTDTGEVQVLDVLAFVDAGKIIRLQGAEMQIEGGIAMGLGHTLTEELILREGRLETKDLTTYLIPTIRDVPQKMDARFINKPTPTTELGAKGLAELALVPVAPAIVNAIHDAIGVWIEQLPATPERVLEALNTRSSSPENFLG
jgi:CO/xanthine dehydrogenase Mo-binding subunit